MRSEKPPYHIRLFDPNFSVIFLFAGMSEGGTGGQLPGAPPDFGRSEGAAGQWQRAALLLAPQIFTPWVFRALK